MAVTVGDFARAARYAPSVMADDISRARAAAARAAARYPAVAMLVLYGSRARDDAAVASDWDLAYVAGAALDPLSLRLELTDALATDAVDLVALDRASALLRFRVARDGVPLFERAPGAFARFWMHAVQFWCEVSPLVRRGNAALLDELRR